MMHARALLLPVLALVTSSVRAQDTYHAVAVSSPAAAARGEDVRNVQSVEAASIAQSHAVSVHEILDARIAGVVVDDVQNNPLQPDLQYRGFTASPLLGTPEGIAIYQNRVRVNDPFGDLVSWDLVPEIAVRDLALGPAGDPRYGQNALGGALVLRMKNGFDRTGPRVSLLGGSFGRYQMSAEDGGVLADHVGVYVGASGFGEDGFREASPSEARHLYTDLRYRSGGSEIGVQLALARSRLYGNGPAPVELLAREGRDALFTYPDITRNSSVMLSLDAKHVLAEEIVLSATGYLRGLGRRTSNGDEAELEPCSNPSDTSLLCDEDGERVHDEDGHVIESAKAYDGLFNTTDTQSFGLGASLQLDVDRKLAERANHFIVGADGDSARIDFLQRAQLGELTDDRSVVAQGIFLSSDELHTDLRADNASFGAYASDTWSVVPRLALTAAARFNWAQTKLDDREGVALDGKHTFTRLNPSLGAKYSPWRPVSFFASYAESNRVPSASELSCADPNAPCRVPNAFVADPPLDQVVSRSVELGARGRARDERFLHALTWSLAAFGSRNQDDILFVAGSHVGTGFFRNAGRTQRIGIEADMAADLGDVHVYLGYVLLRATFESQLDLPGAEHPLADGGVIHVHPGDRIPGIPAHSVKAGMSVNVTPRWDVGVSGVVRSGQPFRGDEGNQLEALDGYAIVNAETRYELFEYVELFVKVQNLLDTRYETFGVIADPSEVLRDTHDPRFVSPGAPFGLWAGIVLHEL